MIIIKTKYKVTPAVITTQSCEILLLSNSVPCFLFQQAFQCIDVLKLVFVYHISLIPCPHQRSPFLLFCTGQLSV